MLDLLKEGCFSPNVRSFFEVWFVTLYYVVIVVDLLNVFHEHDQLQNLNLITKNSETERGAGHTQQTCIKYTNLKTI